MDEDVEVEGGAPEPPEEETDSKKYEEDHTLDISDEIEENEELSENGTN